MKTRNNGDRQPNDQKGGNCNCDQMNCSTCCSKNKQRGPGMGGTGTSQGGMGNRGGMGDSGNMGDSSRQGGSFGQGGSNRQGGSSDQGGSTDYPSKTGSSKTGSNR
jgi:hypothetical protein